MLFRSYDHGANSDDVGTRPDTPNPARATASSVASGSVEATTEVAPAADAEVGDDWVPRSDENDEWRDLPERGSR